MSSLTPDEIDKLLDKWLKDEIDIEELNSKVNNGNMIFKEDPKCPVVEEVKKCTCSKSNPECEVVKSHALGEQFLYCRTHEIEVI